MATTPPTIDDTTKANLRLDCLRLAARDSGGAAATAVRDAKTFSDFVIEGTVPQEPGQ